MRSFEGEWKLLHFEKDYIQSYFEDGTCLSWNKDNITYYSIKGNRVQLNKQSIHHSEDLSAKIVKIVNKINKYNDGYIDLTSQLHDLKKPKQIFKKYKIEQYSWEQGIVRTTVNGDYEIASDDLNATISLSKNLYVVYITFLQKVKGRRISDESVYLGSKNQRKQLLQKYNYKYVEFPLLENASNEIQLEYHLISKQFTIFNIPDRWYPPMKKIWGYILANQLVPHPFCYIDFDDHDNQQINKITHTKMPPFQLLLEESKQQYEVTEISPGNIPLYGIPNHRYPCRWVYVQKQENYFIGHIPTLGGNIICENYGFWFIEEGKAGFRTSNKNDFDYSVSISVFPLTVRLQGQPFRSIRNHIIAFESYLKHKTFIGSKEKEENSPQSYEKNNEIIYAQNIQGIGQFKAYGNGTAVGKFVDKVIMTMNKTEIRVITCSGKSYFINLTVTNQMMKEYNYHISQLTNFYQKIYYPNEWQSKKILNERITDRLKMTQAFLVASQRFQSL